ncbi:MAG: 50S ribosomal protein L24 [Candidatus Peregrinibacteria bacterium]|nr:50S ribosomal protein L24 [Candidatus Peregrinibacteria bacterium]
MKVKTNDQVVVIAGKDKGKKGKVLRVVSKDNRIVVEKVNMRTKHIKKTTQKAGEKIKFEASIDASNVMVICPSCEKTVRVGFKKLENGKKQRVCKKCKDSIDKITQ